MSTTVVVEPPQPPATSVAELQLNGALSPTRDASPSIVDTTASVVVPGQTPADDTSDVKMTNAQDDDAATQIAVTSAMDTIKKEVVTNATAETVGDVEMAEPTAETKLEPVAYSVRAPEDDARAVALARRRLEIQIAFVENARKKIADETHPDFVSRMVEVDAERERLLELAKHKETYWEHCTSVIFAYECEEANSEFIMNCDKLRQEMLDEIQHEIEIINDARKGAASARKTTRKTRSTRTKTGSEEKSPAQETAQKTKKRVGSVFQYLENKLAQSEVDHDLRELNSSLDALSKKRRIDASSAVESPFVAKYHRANFLYRDAIYQEGDEIYVRNLMNGSEYIAIICSITTTELFVLSEKGKYYRLVVMDLRQGRVLLSPLTPDQTATLNEREVREALRS